MAPRLLADPQWFTMLDNVLLSAIEHVMLDTMLMEHYVSQLVNYQLAHKKRHLGVRGNWQYNISRMIEFLVDPTIENFRLMYLDRGYIFAILENFESLSERYELTFEYAFKQVNPDSYGNLLAFHRKIGAKRDVLQTVQAVKSLNGAALLIKSQVIDQYDKYLRARSVYDAKNHPLTSDPKDLYQGYYLAANRAVDHFNLEKGSFKSYLDHWVRKSRNGDHHFYGSAYSVPSGSKAFHLYVPLDDINASVESAFDLVNENSEREHIHKLIALVDPGGYAAQALEIGDRL